MSAPQTMRTTTIQQDWGSSLLVAVAPHLALVVLACSLDVAASLAVILAMFNIVVCLVIGAIAKRAVVFVGASMCLATLGWLFVGFDASNQRERTGYPIKHQTRYEQPSPIPQP